MQQPASLRLAAANDLLDRAYGRPPLAVEVDRRQTEFKRIVHEVRWMNPDPDDHSRVIEPEACLPESNDTSRVIEPKP